MDGQEVTRELELAQGDSNHSNKQSREVLEPLVIKILCAAAQLGLGSSGDFNGTKKH